MRIRIHNTHCKEQSETRVQLYYIIAFNRYRYLAIYYKVNKK
jgi:hypothetical protein